MLANTDLTPKGIVLPATGNALHSDSSRPFTKPKSGGIAVKVINHLGDAVMKVPKV